MSLRNIPRRHLVSIDVADSSKSEKNETISNAKFVRGIENPIKDWLARNDKSSKIQYIVLTRGIPIRTNDTVDGVSQTKSVDGLLAAIGYLDIPRNRIRFSSAPGTFAASAYINKYWNHREIFNHKKFGGYIVTRLDGQTENDAKALVDHALGPRPRVKTFLLDADPAQGAINILAPPPRPPGAAVAFADYNTDIRRAWTLIRFKPQVFAQLEQSTAFIGNHDGLSGYVSWGSNDRTWKNGATLALANENFQTGLKTYRSIRFAPRAIAETAVSTSGRTMFRHERLALPEQSLITDLVAQGVSGTKGYVAEPYLNAIASPSVLFDLYTSGRTLGESFYAASRFVGWRDVVIGDPLCKL